MENILGSINSNDVITDGLSPVLNNVKFIGCCEGENSYTPEAGKDVEYAELLTRIERCSTSLESLTCSDTNTVNEIEIEQNSDNKNQRYEYNNNSATDDDNESSDATNDSSETSFDQEDSTHEIVATAMEAANEAVVISTPNKDEDGSTTKVRRPRINVPLDTVTRKRSTNRWKWKQVLKKNAVNTGQKYVSESGNIVPERKLQRSCDVSCRFKCVSKITDVQRQQILNKFWALGDHNRQWNYIATHIKVRKQNNVLDAHTKRKSKRYYFQTDDGEVKICKTMFLSTLDISDSWIKTVTSKLTKGRDISPDRRGHNQKRGNKVPAEVELSIVDHINAFPRTDSHYVRKTSSKEYLEEHLSVKQMHELYLVWVKDNRDNVKPATERQYRDIFNTRFNISFFKPKKDQCDICLGYKNATVQDKRKLQAQYDLHMSNKVKVRKLKDADKEECLKKENCHISMACFDYQKVLQTPQAQTSIFYYKRKLSVYNFTVYDVGRHEGNCYCYDETVANKGSNEVASLLLDFIDKKVRDGVRDFRVYSDNCSGQNRNRFVFLMYIYAASKYNIKIVHRFLERGHTQNEGDSVHALIERRSKNHVIYTPDQWYDIIMNAKRTKSNPYKVLNVDQHMIFDFKKLVEKQNWAKNTKKEVIAWSKVREVYADGDEPGILLYKLTFESEYSKLNIKHIHHSVNLNAYELEKAYTSKLSISALKLKDLINLCNNKAIPTRYQSFYRNLNEHSTEQVTIEVQLSGSEIEKHVLRVQKASKRENCLASTSRPRTEEGESVAKRVRRHAPWNNFH